MTNWTAKMVAKYITYYGMQNNKENALIFSHQFGKLLHHTVTVGLNLLIKI